MQCGRVGHKCVFVFHRPQDEHHATIKADGRVNDLAEAVELILKFNTVTT